jgi:hypothetical protein
MKPNIGDWVLVHKGNLPLLTVSHILGGVVFFEETNDNCLLRECGTDIKLTENGGNEITLSAIQYDRNRTYYERKQAIVSIF